MDEFDHEGFRYGKAYVKALWELRDSSESDSSALVAELRSRPGLDVMSEKVRDLWGKSSACRKKAANQLGHLAFLYRKSLGDADLPKLHDSLEPLLRSLPGNGPDIQVAILRALCQFVAEPFSAEIVNGLMNDVLILKAHPKVIQAGFDLLVQIGVDAASETVPSMVGLLEHTDWNVQERTCGILGWFKKDAMAATDALLARAIESDLPQIQLAAVKALKQVAPGAGWLAKLKANAPASERLIKYLRSQGPAGRGLRRRLQGTSSNSAKVAKDRRRSKWDDLYLLHDKLKAANPSITDTDILKQFRKRNKGGHTSKGETWREPNVRTLQNYRSRYCKSQVATTQGTTD